MQHLPGARGWTDYGQTELVSVVVVCQTRDHCSFLLLDFWPATPLAPGFRHSIGALASHGRLFSACETGTATAAANHPLPTVPRPRLPRHAGQMPHCLRPGARARARPRPFPRKNHPYPDHDGGDHHGHDGVHPRVGREDVCGVRGVEVEEGGGKERLVVTSVFPCFFPCR